MSRLPCRSQCPAPPTSVSIHTPPPTPAFHQASLYAIWFIATWNDLLPVPSLPSFSFSPSFLACSLPASPFSTSLPQGWGLHFGHCHILRAWIRAWPTVETLKYLSNRGWHLFCLWAAPWLLGLYVDRRKGMTHAYRCPGIAQDLKSGTFSPPRRTCARGRAWECWEGVNLVP